MNYSILAVATFLVLVFGFGVGYGIVGRLSDKYEEIKAQMREIKIAQAEQQNEARYTHDMFEELKKY